MRSSELERLIMPEELLAEDAEEPAANASLAFLPFRLGDYCLAIETTCVNYVGGIDMDWDELSAMVDSLVLARPAEELGLEGITKGEMIVARGGSQGENVGFRVSMTERIFQAPLVDLRPLPPVALETVSVPFFWGVIPHHGKLFVLLDSENLYRFAKEKSERG